MFLKVVILRLFGNPLLLYFQSCATAFTDSHVAGAVQTFGSEFFQTVSISTMASLRLSISGIVSQIKESIDGFKLAYQVMKNPRVLT